MSRRSRLGGWAALLALLFLLPTYLTAQAQTPTPSPSITVDSTGDTLDAAPSCPGVSVDSLPGPDGAVSLREAICAANARVGSDQIRFTLPAGSVINLRTRLPALLDDGTDVAGDTSPGYQANTAAAPERSTLRPGITVDATALARTVPVLQIESGGNRVAGLHLRGNGDGVLLEGRRSVRNRVEAMWLGPRLGGAAVRVRGAAADLVGGLGLREGNVIEGAAAGVVVEASVRVKVVGNAMDDLSGPGIVLSDTPPADTLAPPVLDAESASTLTLVGHGVPGGALVDLFAAGPPDAPTYGRLHLGAFLEGGPSDADRVADGRFTFPLAGLAVVAGDRLTAVAVDANGNTSPFATPVVARIVDGDRDGLADDEEMARGLDPMSADTDGDGIDDGVESCRCSAVFVQQDPPAVIEISTVTGRLLRRLGLPATVRPVTGFTLGRGATGPAVAVASPNGLGVVDLASGAASVVPIDERGRPVASGRPTAALGGMYVYVPEAEGLIAVVHLPTRKLVAVVGSPGHPAALAADGTGVLMAATFAGPSPSIGVYSLSDPERPTLLYQTPLGDRTVTDTVVSPPIVLEGARFATAVGGPEQDAALALFNGTESEPAESALVPPTDVATATVPVALTGGPRANEVSVALTTPDGRSGAIVTVDGRGNQLSASSLSGQPAGLAVSGSGGLIVPLTDGRVVRLTAQSTTPQAAATVGAIQPTGVVGLATPTTGTDALAAASGPGVIASVVPGASVPSVGASVVPSAAPRPSGPSSLSVAPPLAGAPVAAAPPPRPNVVLAASAGGLPAAGASGPVPSAIVITRPVIPQAALVAASLPAAPGGGFALPRAIVPAGTPDAPGSNSRVFLWLMAAACAGFLIGALAVQPAPGALGPRRQPVASWVDDPQAAVFGPARRWEHWLSQPLF